MLLAFVLVALSSVVVLTAGALWGTARGLTATEHESRQQVADAAATAAAAAYRAGGGWADADLSAVDSITANARAGAVVTDESGAQLDQFGAAPGMGMGGMGGMTGRGGVVAPVVVDGAEVGSVRLFFGTGHMSAAQQIAWGWIAAAAAVALLVAVGAAWLVTGRITRPLTRLAGVARAFAGGQRSARSAPADRAAPGEIGVLANAFDDTADAVVRSEQIRAAMTADISHELRTPLAALQAGLEELRDGLVAPDQPRLDGLHAQAQRLGRIVEDLSLLSAAQAGGVGLHPRPVDLTELATEAVGSARPMLEASGLTAEVGGVPDLLVEADPGRLHQCIGNLLTNAARHCRTGDHVRVTALREGPWAVVTVADDGPGIAPEDLPHIFERRWRGNVDVGGSGIGLSIVKELIEAHGGQVSATSRSGAGTSIELHLPLY